jgi:hypothetical protein
MVIPVSVQNIFVSVSFGAATFSTMAFTQTAVNIMTFSITTAASCYK